MAEGKKMPEGKYGKYIVTEFYDKFELPDRKGLGKSDHGQRYAQR